MKKRILIIISSIVILTIGIILVIQFTKPGADVGGDDLTSTLKRPPKNANPLDYTPNENLFFAAYNFSNEPYVEGKTSGNLIASILFIDYNQLINDTRIIDQNCAFKESISYSTLKSVALQRLYLKDKILLRGFDKVNKGGQEVLWKDECDAIDYEKNKELYGLTPFDLSNYILCSETIISSKLVSKTSNTYTYEYVLDTSKAVSLYKHQIKTLGGSRDYPLFKDITYTITIDDNYRVLSSKSVETYDINLPVLGSFTCVSQLEEVFNYSKTEIKEISFFEKYYNIEIDDKIKNEKGLSDYLMEALGKFLIKDKGYFTFIGQVNEDIVTGKIITDLKNMRISASLKADLLSDEIKGEYYKDEVYINYLKFVGKLDITNNPFNDEVDASVLLNDATLEVTDEEIIINMPLSYNDINLVITFYMTEIDNVTTLNSIRIIISYQENILIFNVNESESFEINVNKDNAQRINDLIYLYDFFMDYKETNTIKVDAKINNISISGYIKKKDILHAELVINAYDYGIENCKLYINNEDYYITMNNVKLKTNLNDLKQLIIKLVLSGYLNLPSTTTDSIFNFDLDFDSIINNLIIDEKRISFNVFNNWLVFDYNEDLDCIFIMTTLPFSIIKDLEINVLPVVYNDFEDEFNDYYDLSNIFKNFDDIKHLLTKVYEGNIDTTINISNKEVDLDIEYYLDLRDINNIKFDSQIQISIDEMIIYCNLLCLNNELYLTYLNKTIKVSFKEIIELLNGITEDDMECNILSNIDLKNISIDYNELTKSTVIVVPIDTYLVNINIFIDKSAIYITVSSDLNPSLKEIKFTIKPGKEKDLLGIEKVLVYDDLMTIKDLVTYFNDLINNKKIDFNIKSNININDVTVPVEFTGLVDLDLFKINCNVLFSYLNNDYSINIKYIENIFYINYLNNHLKISFSKLQELLKNNDIEFDLENKDVKINKEMIDNIISNIDIDCNNLSSIISISLKNINSLINNIIIDKNDNIVSIKTNDFSIYEDNDYSINISNINGCLNKSNNEIVLDDFNYINASKIINNLSSILDLLKNQVMIEIETLIDYGEYSDISVKGQAYVDYSENLINGSFIVCYNHINLMFDVRLTKDFIYVVIGNEIIRIDNNNLYNPTSNDLDFDYLMSIVNTIIIRELNNGLSFEVSNLIDNPIKLSISTIEDGFKVMLDDVLDYQSIRFNTLIIMIKEAHDYRLEELDPNVCLTYEMIDEFLNDLKEVQDNKNIVLNFSGSFEYLENVIDFLSEVSFNLDNKQFKALLSFDYKNNIYDIELYYVDEVLYFIYNDVSLKITKKELIELLDLTDLNELDDFDNNLNVDYQTLIDYFINNLTITLSNKKYNVNLTNVNSILNIFSLNNININNNQLSFSINIDNDVRFELDNLKVDYSNYSIYLDDLNIFVTNNDFIIDVPLNDYVSLSKLKQIKDNININGVSNVISFVSEIIKTKKMIFEYSFELNILDDKTNSIVLPIDLNSYIDFNDINNIIFSVKLSTSFKGNNYDIYLLYENNILDVTWNNIGLEITKQEIINYLNHNYELYQVGSTLDEKQESNINYNNLISYILNNVNIVIDENNIDLKVLYLDKLFEVLNINRELKDLLNFNNLELQLLINEEGLIVKTCDIDIIFDSYNIILSNTLLKIGKTIDNPIIINKEEIEIVSIDDIYDMIDKYQKSKEYVLNKEYYLDVDLTFQMNDDVYALSGSLYISLEDNDYHIFSDLHLIVNSQDIFINLYYNWNCYSYLSISLDKYSESTKIKLSTTTLEEIINMTIDYINSESKNNENVLFTDETLNINNLNDSFDNIKGINLNNIIKEFSYLKDKVLLTLNLQEFVNSDEESTLSLGIEFSNNYLKEVIINQFVYDSYRLNGSINIIDKFDIVIYEEDYIDFSSITPLVNAGFKTFVKLEKGIQLNGLCNIGIDSNTLKFPFVLKAKKQDKQILIDFVIDVEGMPGITNGQTNTHITIDNGLVYITRHQTTEFKFVVVSSKCDKYEYRLLRIDELLSNMMDYLSFIFNFSSVISDKITSNVIMRSMMSSSLVKDYINIDNEYRFVLNLNKFVNSRFFDDVNISIFINEDNIEKMIMNIDIVQKANVEVVCLKDEGTGEISFTDAINNIIIVSGMCN